MKQGERTQKEQEENLDSLRGLLNLFILEKEKKRVSSSFPSNLGLHVNISVKLALTDLLKIATPNTTFSLTIPLYFLTFIAF